MTSLSHLGKAGTCCFPSKADVRIPASLRAQGLPFLTCAFFHKNQSPKCHRSFLLAATDSIPPPSPCQASWFAVASSCCGGGKCLAPAQGQYGGLGTSPRPPWIENGKQRAITCHTWQQVQTRESFSPPEQDSSMLCNCYRIQTSKPTILFVTDACFCQGKCTFRAGWESLLSTGQQHWKLFSPLTYFLKVPLFNFNTQLQFFHITLDKSCKLPPYWHHITSNQLINHKGLAFSYQLITGEMGFQKAWPACNAFLGLTLRPSKQKQI